MHEDPCFALAEFVVSSLPEPVVVLDSEGAIAFTNQAARERDDVTGLFAPGAREPLVSAFFADVRDHGVAKADIRVNAGMLRLEGTAVQAFFVVVVRDVSERRELDQEIQQLRSGAALGLVAATLVHDFNNVLTPVLLLSSRLASELERGSRAHMIASEVHSAATLGAALMRDVISLSRPRARLIERVNVNEVIAERLGLIARLLGDTVTIEHQPEDELGDVLVDRKRFEHALLNLVANARDAMPDGGRLTIATRLVGPASEPSVTIAVADTGIGMTEDVRRRAFESFFTTKADSGGTGIGLASVYRFARESGGHIALESEPRKGTTATLVLPRLAASHPTRTSHVERLEVACGNATVLVADRNGTVSRAIQLALEARGYRVVLASNAENALEMAASERPEVALIDTHLAHRDPRTFLHRLRAASGAVHIVFLSVAPEPGPANDVDVTFLPKAFSDEELARAVREALSSLS